MSQCSERVKHAVPPAPRFLRTFLAACACGKRPPPSLTIAARARGEGTTAEQILFLAENEKPLSPCPRLSCPANPHGGRRGKRRYLCGYVDIIYSTSRTAHCARPFLICNSGLPRPPLARSTLADSQCRPSRHHQKHTNWSQIMHESPQSARFTGLHCIPRIGGILLCLFFF
jgi:hypothetical protein